MTEKDRDKSLELVSDAERDLALVALAEFKKKNCADCLQNIIKLEAGRPNDFKILHNKAVVEYYQSELKRSAEFQKNLSAICNQFKIKVDKLEEIDYCIAQFNQVVMLFHEKQYTAAQRIMDRVYKFIEPMEEELGKQVSLLAIELQICLKRPDKALTLISYLENNLMYGGSIPLKGLGLVKGVKEKKLPLPTPKPIPEEFQKKLMKYKVRCYLLNHSIKTASKEIPLMLKDKSKPEAIFFAANLEYLKGNFDESLKLLHTIPENAFTFSDYGESSKVLFFNSLGVLHHVLGKPSLACYYFQTALKEDIGFFQALQQKDDDDKVLYVKGGSKYHELLYNLGVSLLYAGRASEAFECLIICVRRYHRNSRLWLRIAECCIAVHKGSNEPDFDLQQKQKELIAEIIGTRDKQKVILVNSLSNDKKYSTDNQSYAIPVPTLEFASLCLRNAKLLIPADSSKVPPEPLFLVPGVTPPAPPPAPTLAPSSPPSPDEIQALKNAILVATAYVHLCLGDFVTALKNSKELLAQEKISGCHKLLGHLYAAESLVLSDQLDEALDHLNPQQVKDIVFHFDVDSSLEEESVKASPSTKWFPPNVAGACAVMQYNLAVAQTMRGQLDHAGELLRQVWQQRSTECPVPAHIIMLVIYIELQLGHAEIARNLLRQYSIQQRISG